MLELQQMIKSIRPVDATAMQQAKIHWDNVAKPLNSLGKLESAVIRIAGIQRTERVDISRPAICVMCADNGVVAQGVTQTDSSVTAIVADNMTCGKSSVCLMGKVINAKVIPVDIGINRKHSVDGLVNKKIMNGTKDITLGPAMTREQAVAAIKAGIEMVNTLKNDGHNIIITGEMGIGNTTTSSAIASVLLNCSVETVTGKGAGLTGEGLARKISAIKTAIGVNKPDKSDALDILSKIGGLDIAGMVGLYIGGAIYGVPIVIDGFISAVSAYIAKKMAPTCFDYMLPSHVSAEPAGQIILTELGLDPLLICDMCLGEGTGGVAAVGVIQMGAAVYNSMSSFEEIKVEKYVHLT